MKTTVWLLLALLVLFTRSGWRLSRPQFFAEDGRVFFADAANRGLPSLLSPYQGYLHAAPRLVAAAAQPLPWEWLPSVYAFAAAAFTLYVVWRVFSARLPPAIALVSSATLLIVPHNGEIWSNLCCLHFVLAALLAVNLLEPAPATGPESGRRGIEMAVAALSGPEVFVFAPALIWTAWRIRGDKLGSRMMAIALGGSAVQLLVLAFNPRSSTVDLAALAATAVTAAIGYSQFLFAGAGPGTFINLRSTYVSAQTLVGVGAMVLTLIVALDRGNRRRVVAGIIAAHAAAFLVLARIATVDAHHIFPSPLGYGARYAYLPQVLLIWAVAWLFQGELEQGRRRLAMAFLAVIPLALVPISVARHWAGVVLADRGWSNQVREARAGRRTMFETPPDWSFPVPRRADR